MEFRGGTYISQVEAEDAFNSINAWIEKLSENIQPETDLNEELILALRHEYAPTDYGHPTAISGTNGVWCLDFVVGKDFGLVNIVRTDPTE